MVGYRGTFTAPKVNKPTSITLHSERLFDVIMAILSPALIPILTSALLIALDLFTNSSEEILCHFPSYFVENALSSGAF